MAILNFQKPDKVIMIDSTDFEGKFEFRPLEPGYGLTVGNALRRVLLSSLEGFAITSVRIEGVEHEFSTISGVVEDVTEIILNLKQIRFKRQIDEIDNESVTISISGQEQITAGDFQRFISGSKTRPYFSFGSFRWKFLWLPQWSCSNSNCHLVLDSLGNPESQDLDY